MACDISKGLQAQTWNFTYLEEKSVNGMQSYPWPPCTDVCAHMETHIAQQQATSTKASMH